MYFWFNICIKIEAKGPFLNTYYSLYGFMTLLTPASSPKYFFLTFQLKIFFHLDQMAMLLLCVSLGCL